MDETCKGPTFSDFMKYRNQPMSRLVSFDTIKKEAERFYETHSDDLTDFLLFLEQGIFKEEKPQQESDGQISIYDILEEE